MRLTIGAAEPRAEAGAAPSCAPPLVADRTVLDDLFTMVDSALVELDGWVAKSHGV